jgi:ABC-2 type transport system ATP-binding protein
LWIERLILEPYSSVAGRDLSKGNARKVQMAIALLAHPSILILDEPFDGMDPTNSYLVQKLLQEVQQQGMTVLISSHSLEFLSDLCRSVTIIQHGQTILHGNLEHLQESQPWRFLTIRFRHRDPIRLSQWEMRTPIQRETSPGSHIYRYRVARNDVETIHIQDLLAVGDLTAFTIDPPSLTALYWDVISHTQESSTCVMD